MKVVFSHKKAARRGYRHEGAGAEWGGDNHVQLILKSEIQVIVLQRVRYCVLVCVCMCV